MSSQTATDTHPIGPGPGRRLNGMAWFSLAGCAVVVGILGHYLLSHPEAGHAVHHEVPAYWGLGVLPFGGILACIAFLPLIGATHHWWESNLNRLGVALGFALVTLAYYAAVRGPAALGPVLSHAVLAEYVPFIVLLFCLYVVSGGISLRGDLAAHPGTNTAFIAVGTLAASLIGTTGASMLLIRPLLQTNAERRHKVHTVVFFIFLVSNIGGSLLPVGDPPLFLGYLKGVHFFWTLSLWPEWLATSAVLLALYYVLDHHYYKKERPEDIRRDETQRQPLRLEGGLNFLFLLGVVASVAFIVEGEPLPGIGLVPFPFLREIVMLVLAAAAYATTKKAIREFNHFDFAAIAEVAALFIGIFIAMQVPVQVLNVKGSELGLNEPWHFFWATGALSSFLDNAPTYVVFFETANGMTHVSGPGVLTLLGGEFIRETFLAAISLGAVFMGSMTYIGNGPNFMVKAIAEQSGIAMPSFPGYMFKYSIPILIPVFVAVVLIFL